jgi:hypothetical protein
LIFGGILSFLPVLRLWMLPLGLVLFAPDLAFPERPMAPMLGRVEPNWIGRQRAKSVQ